MEKKKFILDEIWGLTIMAAFQRANVYVSDKIIEENYKIDFKKSLREFIDTLIKPYYSEIVTPEYHLKHIWEISKFTESNFSDLLNNGKLNFGVSQKLLNLYLKYLWCLDIIKTPPHFPVDRRIQELMKVPVIYSWTKMEDENHYLKTIDYARHFLKSTSCKSLAELELNLFNSKSNQ